MQELKCVVNGKDVAIMIDPSHSLADVIRYDLGLTGTKKGCEEGECGACTVLVDGLPVDSCIVPAMKAQGRSILTIEGLEQNGELDPIQEAFVEAGAIQCGFCTPGVVLSAKALLMREENPTKEEVRDELSGHFCRCTGYLQFYDAVRIASEKIKARKAAR
ncbi:(2Fe-2S)-binding protein [Cloacibacillus porcorum]|jgi:aerobic carbon-monoxide dehydrogenase small subunit|uniref:(2Fe-2S)-binding protein n=1 Tax=Cloacibacillus porcorum TaxID=1197717 RepID=A0A1B2I839_9BACT|nr:(2Fe-2S)-binding protein [Cloacibacillus porcorum]ANZ46116.1 (2Fe-2S)-binding protein [Cloacibacillus porcorum]MCC8184581.1 (2Fe-2S)-binding protein [Cloacibacillus porcorum]MCD7876891.1 (2Fe-2S)-binding protein [Cloacibacillus porcorum]MCD8391808.1 (2Fe-2S)-binding protein [Cloacibacillus porcorum]MDD7649193.1 (2Fe-2S)-binding protein [Cloacibacillus porcorum]